MGTHRKHALLNMLDFKASHARKLLMLGIALLITDAMITRASLFSAYTHVNAASRRSTQLMTLPNQTVNNFSIFWITDTQCLSSDNPSKFNDLAKWIVANSNYYNAKVVVHTGDIVDQADTSSQWDAANTSMALLLKSGVPYCWCAGNHDQYGNPNSDWMGSKYLAFNQKVMEQKPFWLSDICDGKDTAVHFSSAGYDFLVIDIEYHANSTVLAWVNNLLKYHSNSYVILATHSYIYHTLTYDAPWATTLKMTVLANHANVYTTLNGHNHGDFGAHTRVGNRNELMFDRQDSEYPNGAATVTILTFDTANSQIKVKTYDINTARFMTDPNDQFTLPTTFAGKLVHNIAVLHAGNAKSTIGKGLTDKVTFLAADEGNYAESFSVTAYTNGHAIGTQRVNLNPLDQKTLTFLWNTAGLAYGDYTLSAYARPVLGETDTSDNNVTAGVVKVTIPGDINGDFKVALPDLSLLAKAYGTTPTKSKWNANADIDGNGRVDMADMVIALVNFGQHYP